MSDSCFVVGGGPSLQGFNYRLLDGEHVIAVNQAIFHTPQAKYFVTMDYTWLHSSGVMVGDKLSPVKGKQFHQHPAQKVFVLAFSEPRLQQLTEDTFLDLQYGMHYNLSMFHRVVRGSGYGGIGTHYSNFRVGSDSGYSALQLAVILGYKRIYLLGFDFCTSGTQTHGHNDYQPKDPVAFDAKLQEFVTPYPKAFDSLREIGVQVFSGSHISRLNRYILYVDVTYLLQEKKV